MQSPRLIPEYPIDKPPPLAWSTRRRKHAHRSHHRLPLLHHLDPAYGILSLIIYV
jgi:hypothetical protein